MLAYTICLAVVSSLFWAPKGLIELLKVYSEFPSTWLANRIMSFWQANHGVFVLVKSWYLAGGQDQGFLCSPQTNLHVNRSLVSSVVQFSFVKMIDCWSFEVIMFLLSQTLWNVICLQMCEINESPLFLKLNPLAKTNDVSYY